MHRAILLLAYLAIASCLRVNFPEEQKCEGSDCVKLMDDIHWTPKDKRTFRNLPEVSNRLQSIYCTTGAGFCSLSYLDDGVSKHNYVKYWEHDDASPMFYDIALKAGTDKVTLHHYDNLYQRYLGMINYDNDFPFVFVEIGFSEGKSARAWHEWLGQADVHEFDANCDQEYNMHATAPDHLNLHALSEKDKRHRDLGYCKLHCGDGTNVAFIDEALAGVEKPFVVVDDGGHGPEEMKESFKNWWPRVQPGGLFFIEDLEESFDGSKNGFVESVMKTMVQDILDSKSTPGVSEGVESIECMQAICVFRKQK